MGESLSSQEREREKQKKKKIFTKFIAGLNLIVDLITNSPSKTKCVEYVIGVLVDIENNYSAYLTDT